MLRQVIRVSVRGLDPGVGGVPRSARQHVTSFEEASYVFFQAVLTTGEYAGQQALFVVDVDDPGVRVVRTPAYTHSIGHAHPIVAFEGVRVPASHLVGTEADGMAEGFALLIPCVPDAASTDRSHPSRVMLAAEHARRPRRGA